MVCLPELKHGWHSYGKKRQGAQYPSQTVNSSGKPFYLLKEELRIATS
jgi:hypothetical protein